MAGLRGYSRSTQATDTDGSHDERHSDAHGVDMERPDLGAPDLRIHYVRVTNNRDVPCTDRWDGIPVTLEPGKKDNLQLDMAAHFFGYYYGVDPEAMFRHVCKRQGWNTPAHLTVGESGKPLAREMFDKLSIEPVIYKMVEVEPDTDAPIPAEAEFAKNDLPALPTRKAGGK
jgi:hypothetical protein